MHACLTTGIRDLTCACCGVHARNDRGASKLPGACLVPAHVNAWMRIHERVRKRVHM